MELKKALEKRELGQRTQYDLPDKLKNALAKLDITIENSTNLIHKAPCELKSESESLTMNSLCAHTLFLEQAYRGYRLFKNSRSKETTCSSQLASSPARLSVNFMAT